MGVEKAELHLRSFGSTEGTVNMYKMTREHAPVTIPHTQHRRNIVHVQNGTLYMYKMEHKHAPDNIPHTKHHTDVTTALKLSINGTTVGEKRVMKDRPLAPSACSDKNHSASLRDR